MLCQADAQSFLRFHAALSNRRVHISLPFSYPQMAIDGQFGFDRAREARIDPEPLNLTHVEEVCSSQSLQQCGVHSQTPSH